MRVLHLIDGTGGQAGRGRLDEATLACRLLLERGRHDQRVCVVGPREAVKRVTRLGVRIDASVAPAMGWALMAWRSLARIGQELSPDLVHCWGGDMLELSRLAFGPGVARAAVLDEPGSPLLCSAADWLGAPPGRTILLCHTEASQGAMRRAWPGVEVDLVAPGVPRGIGPDRDPVVRHELGLSEEDVAILLVGDPPHAVANRFAFLAALLGVCGASPVGVMRADAAQGARARRFLSKGPVKARVAISDRPAHELARACDVGVWDAGGAGPTTHRPTDGRLAVVPVAGAMSQGLPVVTPSVPTLRALLGADSLGQCVALSSAIPELGRVLMPLVSNRERRETLRGAVFGHAASLRLQEHFVSAAHDAWGRVSEGATARAPAPMALGDAPTWGLAP